MWVTRRTNTSPTTSDRMCCAHDRAMVRFGSAFDTSDTFVLYSVDMISTAALEELAVSHGIRNFMSAMNASSLKVSMSAPPQVAHAARDGALLLLPARRPRAWLADPCLWQAGSSSRGDQSRTLAHLNAVLPGAV